MGDAIMLESSSAEKEIVSEKETVRETYGSRESIGARKVVLRGSPEDVLKLLRGIKEEWPEFLVGAKVSVSDTDGNSATDEDPEDAMGFAEVSQVK